MPATGKSSRPPRAAGVCMSELLASCAAAAATTSRWPAWGAS